MRGGEDQAETHAEVEDAVVHLAAVDTVATTGEDLIFGFTFYGAGLGAAVWCSGEPGCCEKNRNGDRAKISGEMGHPMAPILFWRGIARPCDANWW